MFMDMCLEMCTDMYTDMCANMFIDMFIDIFVDMCIRHVSGELGLLFSAAWLVGDETLGCASGRETTSLRGYPVAMCDA